MDVDESVSLSKPKAPAKPGKEPEDVSLTHKTPAEIKPTVRNFKVYNPKIIEITLTINFNINIEFRRTRLKLNSVLRNLKLSRKRQLKDLQLKNQKRRYGSQIKYYYTFWYRYYSITSQNDKKYSVISN